MRLCFRKSEIGNSNGTRNNQMRDNTKNLFFDIGLAVNRTRNARDGDATKTLQAIPRRLSKLQKNWIYIEFCV